eukprot:CAMPEP_0178746380 /NCGR_PEP_ID=MMETSP0744-20121128/7778_1 /TAXON_ID=913974 /ORGANISM="Nitzschia punctata, Strain CCMP561" /LENGTH=418 /DNA_ID=CAMNT_0020399587 /DNA_START=156 /DNA_END=1412 /DNA_ORIENTATION=+
MMMNNQNGFPQNGGMMNLGNDPTGLSGSSNSNGGGNPLGLGGNTNNMNANNSGNNANSVSAFLRGGGGVGGNAAQGMMGMGNQNMGGNSNIPNMNSMMNAMNNNAQAQMNMNAMNMNNFNLGELKRLQQLQQLQQASNNAAAQNPLLVPPSAHPQQDPSAAILQSYLDQKIQSSRFGELGMGGGMGGLQGASLQGTGLQGQNPMLGGANLLMMNQGNMGGAGLGNASNEVPLPSPHSLFHRDGSRRMRGGVIEPFPEKLHRLLLEVEAAGRGDVISFVANGRAFAIHKPEKFFKEIVPLYFRQSRLSSFKRQLNLYGFELINTGPARGGYYHELFVKDRPELCRRMRRVAVKVTPRTGDPSDVSKDKETSVEKPSVEKPLDETPVKAAEDSDEVDNKDTAESGLTSTTAEGLPAVEAS